jgi:hypothetical protein
MQCIRIAYALHTNCIRIVYALYTHCILTCIYTDYALHIFEKYAVCICNAVTLNLSPFYLYKTKDPSLKSTDHVH